MIQLRAEDPSGSVHTTWCHHPHENRKSALKECKSFFPADDGYKNHLVMTPVELARELECEEPPFGNCKLVQIGTVEVDSGMVCIADPCRVSELNAADIAAVQRLKQYKRDNPELKVTPSDVLTTGCEAGLRLMEQVEHSPYFVTSPTAYGDDAYPVFADIHTDRNGNETVLGLLISFDPRGFKEKLLKMKPGSDSGHAA
jgi:hypothetical protein